MEAKKIGIITVLYNSSKVLDDFFLSLEKQDYKNITLYIIDNKSSDDSLIHAKELADKVTFKTFFIENDGNFGVAKGNNEGILKALQDNCDYILITNNDIVIEKKTISHLVETIQVRKADLIVPKIYFYDSNRLWFAGGKFKLFSGSIQHNGYGTIDTGKYSKSKFITYAPTCFMLIDKNVFYDIGLMDEKYFVYFDDTDFVFRAVKKAKKKLYYDADVNIQHKESYSTGGVKSDFTLKYYYRNKIYFQKKHAKFPELMYLLNLIYFNLKQKKIGTDLYKKICVSLKNGHIGNME